ncbi:hypothetical protein ACGFZH_40340 [Streptomyces zaomyceticus]|uniref:hypothetical protein n=1 Tax=Streptomyces zaomyceticus TaxID=68286 RepID=UPI003712753A
MISVTDQNVTFLKRGLARHAKKIAPGAERLVAREFGALPATQVIVTSDPGLMAELATDAEHELAPGADPRAVAKALRHHRRHLRDKYGVTVLSTDGVLVLINLRVARTTQDVNETLTHELVHACQLRDRPAREQHIGYVRYGLGTERLSRRKVRAYESLMDQREDQAHAAEHLAAGLPL